MQKTLLIGYLGKDPEMKYTPGGTAITTFTVANTERWKNSAGEPQEHTEWSYKRGCQETFFSPNRRRESFSHIQPPIASSSGSLFAAERQTSPRRIVAIQWFHDTIILNAIRFL